jgi:hypothetical protein
MTISVKEHFLNFMDKYHRVVIDISPFSLVVTYTRDIDINNIKDALEHFYESLVGYCNTGVMCQMNAQRIFSEKGYPYFFLYDPSSHDSLSNTPEEFIRTYGTFGNTVGYTHHSLPYVKFRVRTQYGQIERYRMAVETTEENSIQFYVTKTEAELLEMLKERYLYSNITVPKDPLNTYWYDVYGEDPYIPNESAFGRRTKKRRHQKRRRTTKHLKRRKNSKR